VMMANDTIPTRTNVPLNPPAGNTRRTSRTAVSTTRATRGPEKKVRADGTVTKIPTDSQIRQGEHGARREETVAHVGPMIAELTFSRRHEAPRRTRSDLGQDQNHSS
jgi:hypothetical protein